MNDNVTVQKQEQQPDMSVQKSIPAIDSASIKGGVASLPSLPMPHSSSPFSSPGNNDATQKVKLTRGDRIGLALKAYGGSL